MVPPLLNEKIFGHADLIAHLTRQLVSTLVETPEERHCFALYGIPGAGKSTLATVIARQPAIDEFFDGGVLWAELGSKADEKAFLFQWALAVGIDRQVADTASPEERRTLILGRLGSRRVLVVVDDVYKTRHVKAHLLGGNCVYLITSKRPDIAIPFAGSRATTIPELGSGDALAMLRNYAPAAVDKFHELALKLVEAASGLPLALSLIGGQLLKATIGNQLNRMKRALEVALQQGHSEELEPYIALSDEALNENERRSWYALSVFRAKPGDFSEAAALAVAECSSETLYVLLDAGVIEVKSDKNGDARFTLHKSIADYTARQIAKHPTAAAAASARMMRYFVEFMEKHRGDLDRIASEIANIDTVLSRAIQKGYDDVLLLRGANAYSEFLLCRGLNSRAERYLRAALSAAERLGDAQAAADATLNLAHHLEKLGSYEDATEALRKYAGLSEAQTPLRSAQACYIHAVIAFNRCEYDRAREEITEGIKILERYERVHEGKILGHPVEAFGTPEREQALRIMCDLLERRCLVTTFEKTSNIGENVWKEAHADVRRGLTLARRLDDRRRQTEHLLNWAWVNLRADRIKRAHRIAILGHKLALRFEQREYEIGFLHRLGCVAVALEKLDLAEKFYWAGLLAAEHIQHRWYIVLLNLDLGRLYWRLGDAARAWGPLNMAQEHAGKIGSSSMRDEAAFMLAEPYKPAPIVVEPAPPPVAPDRLEVEVERLPADRAKGSDSDASEALA
jgi:hypothetical protein